MRSIGVLLFWFVVIAATILGFIFLYREDQMAFWIGLAALALFLVYVGVTSVYVVRPDDMIASYFLGTHRTTYVNHRYARNPTVIAKGGWNRGHIGDIVFLLWPLWKAVRFPTTAVRVSVMVTRVLTRGLLRPAAPQALRIPRVRLRLDSTMIFRLSPRVATVVETFKLLDKGDDLTISVEYTDNADRRFSEPLIARILESVAKETILEAVRVAGSRYTFGGPDDDIVTNKNLLEEDVKRILSEPESVFSQSGLLVPIAANAPAGTPHRDGPAVISLDFNIEEIAPDPLPDGASELERAIDRPYVSILEAEATVTAAEAEGTRERILQQRRGEGKAVGLRAIADALPPQDRDIYLGDVLREATSNTSVNLIGGERLTGILGAVLGTPLPPQPPPAPGGAQPTGTPAPPQTPPPTGGTQTGGNP